VTRPAKIGAAEALKTLPGWTAVAGGRDAIQRSYRFVDFKRAFDFMGRVAAMADQLDHHPEWFNVYNRVDVVLATHDADGVTELDVALASFMDEAADAVSAE
jgi:4a-hydroxytetrahydrobiopterin dehydratase